MAATEILKTRVTPETKGRVGEVVRSELLTEAIWLRRLVTKALLEQGAHQAKHSEGGATTLAAPYPKTRERTSRLYVRVRREDGLLLAERAAARGMASATYLSVLLRSHLRALTPLPAEELSTLKRAVAELGVVGRNLNQIALGASEGTRGATLGHEEFRAILKICEVLRDRMKDLIKSNTLSWASGYVEKTL